MSKYDDRSNAPSDAEDGLFQPARSGGARSNYSASGRDPAHEFDHFAEFDESGAPSGGGVTAKLPDPGEVGYQRSEYDADYDHEREGADRNYLADEFAEDDARRKVSWHSGADLGLLVLRLAVGGTFIAHGLQHAFGLLHGIGISGFTHFIATGGFKYAHILAWVTGGTELAGGALLVVGLFTPLAAAGLLAIMANVVVLKWHLGFFTPGYELELVLASAAFALLFAGPGRASLDRPLPWFRRPGLNGFIFLVIAAAAAVVAQLVLRVR